MTERVEGASSLSVYDFPGRYEDAGGSEDITWTVRPSTRRSPPGQAGFELHTVIRGVPFWGYDFDGLSADDAAAASNAGLADDLFGRDAPPCVLSGDLPCVIERQGRRMGTTISFSLDVGPVSDPNAKILRLSTTFEDRTYEVADEWFEDGLQRLEGELPEGLTLVCCVTCLFSDYSPGGPGLLGMFCHRGAKEQYLAVQSKHDYWYVPRTEEVMETHLCPEYERRVQGTGYRG